jgi:hypothetical protein
MEFSLTDSARELQEITHASREREEVSDGELLNLTTTTNS